MNNDRILHIALFLAVLGVACAFRVPGLDARPMHGDEANQAYRLKILLEEGIYEYDPFEHHGPTLYYSMLPFLKVAGVETFQEMTETQLRLLTVLFGIATVLLIAPMARALGRWAAFWAALLTAVSHAMVYYSRYYIQESLFVFFIVAALYCGWRFFESRTWRWAIATGVCLGLLHATKETCVLVYAAMAGGLVCVWLMDRMGCCAPAEDAKGEAARCPLCPGQITAIVASALVVSVVLFSSFFTHWRGPLDSILTYATYLGRAEGTGSTGLHDQPWHFYLQRLAYHTGGTRPVWSEGLILGLALLGSVVAFATRPQSGDTRFLRFLAFFAVLMTAAFCLIPYKTPWNLLAFYQPLILLAGVGAAWIVLLGRWWPVRAVLVLGLLAGTVQLGKQTHRGTTIFAADPRNPYVYAHTARKLVDETERIRELSSHHPDGKSMHINIIRESADYWPLPWYLRDFDRVGYWPEMPEVPDAPVIVTGLETAELVEGLLEGEYHSLIAALRPGVLLQIFVEADLWEAYMESRR